MGVVGSGHTIYTRLRVFGLYKRVFPGFLTPIVDSPLKTHTLPNPNRQGHQWIKPRFRFTFVSSSVARAHLPTNCFPVYYPNQWWSPTAAEPPALIRHCEPHPSAEPASLVCRLAHSVVLSYRNIGGPHTIESEKLRGWGLAARVELCLEVRQPVVELDDFGQVGVHNLD